MIICHIRTSAGARFSVHTDLEDLRRELVEYWNEVRADGDGDELDDDASLDDALDLIEEFEDVSYEEVEAPDFYRVDALATECMRSENRIVQDYHKLAGACARTAEVGGGIHHRQCYLLNEATNLLAAVHHTHPNLSAALRLKVAARVAERANAVS